MKRAGVYALIGRDAESQIPRLYVGEGDPIGPRLDQHAKNKDFWTHLVAFTSKDQNLNKAHVQYLESHLLELARAAKRSILDNGNVPQPPSLSEADAAETEGFLADILLCFPILGYVFFESAPSIAPSSQEYFITSKGVQAKGFESPMGFVVRTGSTSVKSEVKSIHNYLRELRMTLVTQGLFIDRGDRYEVTQDYQFDSPSTAAGVILGRSANGRVEWQTKDGRTLKSVQEAQVK